MVIRYRGIFPDRLDAPFLGTLIFAPTCHHDCVGCSHEHIKATENFLFETEQEIIAKVRRDPFCQGIILGGLEWSEQPEATLALVKEAQASGLKVMLYTWHTEAELTKLLPQIYSYPGIFIKYGEYREDLRVEGYTSYGIPLASTNQYIGVT